MAFPLSELFAATTLALPAACVVSGLAVRRGFPVTPLSDRLGYIDGLRGLLALAVMTHHFSFWLRMRLGDGRWGPPNDLYYNFGKGGVACFFMITGLVFYRYASAGVDKVSWPKVLTSRAFRILPLSLMAVALAAAASFWLAHGGSRPSILATARALGEWLVGYAEPPLFGYGGSEMLNAGVMWSLGFEWLFYLAILPALAILSFFLRGRAPPVLAPVALIVLALAWRLHRPEALKPVYLLLFGLGMVIAELRRSAQLAAWLSGRVAAAAVVVALALAMAFSDTAYTAGPLAAYTALVLAVASGNNLFGLLATAPVRALGDASFGIYMLHGFVLSALMPGLTAHTAAHPVWWLPLVAAVVAAVSLAAYVGIERPMIELGKRVAHWRPQRDRSLQVEVAP